MNHPTHKARLIAQQAVAITLFLLLGMNQRLIAQAAQNKRCAVSGQVSSFRSHEKIANAALELVPLSGRNDELAKDPAQPANVSSQQGQSRAIATSTIEGAFCFNSVPTGKYELVGRKAGFLETKYGTQSPYQAGIILDIQPSQEVKLDLALLPQGIISGKILNADNDPVDDGTVKLMAKRFLGGKTRQVVVAALTPNDLGEFRFGKLAPGRYFALFEPAAGPRSKNEADPLNRSRTVRTFYPSALTINNATPIMIGLGDETTAINILVQQRATHRIQGKVLGVSRPSGAAGMNLTPSDNDSPTLSISNNYLNADGTFEFDDISPGSYKITYVASMGQSTAMASTVVNMMDSDVTDVPLRVGENASIIGMISSDNDSSFGALSQVQVFLAPLDSLVAPSYSAHVQPDGRFVIDQCIPGQYAVHVKTPSGTYMKSLRSGPTEIKNGVVNVSGGRLELAIALGTGTAQINGLIELPQDSVAPEKKAPSVYYLVVPAGGVLDDVRFGYAESSGRFSVADLPPGQYRMFAIEAPDIISLQNPALRSALEPLGTLVDLKKNEHVDITVRLISANDSGRIFSQAW